jgi:hypothetical protein
MGKKIIKVECHNTIFRLFEADIKTIYYIRKENGPQIPKFKPIFKIKRQYSAEGTDVEMFN